MMVKTSSSRAMSLHENADGTMAGTLGELLAAVDGAALTLILSRLLERAGTPADELTVTAEHTYAGAWCEVDVFHFKLTARVPGADREVIDEATLRAVEQWRASFGLGAERSVCVETELR